MDRRSFGKGAAVAGLARRWASGGCSAPTSASGWDHRLRGKGQSCGRTSSPSPTSTRSRSATSTRLSSTRAWSCGRARPEPTGLPPLLDDKDVDAVIVATPDHWHALQTVAACRAGKDVYVEKPLSLFVREGRIMVDEARKHKRVVQTGSQQRSGAHYAKAVELIREGAIGAVHQVTAGFTRNVLPGFMPRDLPVKRRQPRLGHVAGAGAEGGLRSVPLHLPLPLVLGLLGRADDQLRRAPPGHRALGARGAGADGGRRLRRPLRDQGRRRDARRAGGALPVPELRGHLVGARDQPRRAPVRHRVSRHARPRWGSRAAGSRSRPEGKGGAAQHAAAAMEEKGADLDRPTSPTSSTA